MIIAFRRLFSAWDQDAPMLVLIGRLGVVALGFTTTLIVARAIGPTGRGETAAAIALFYLVPIVLGLGVPVEVRRRTAENDSIHLGRSYRVYSVLTLPLAIVIALGLTHSALQSLESDSRTVAAVGIALAPVSVMWMCDVSVVLARRKFRRFLLIQLTQPTVFCLLTLASWGLGRASTAVVLACHVSGSLATALLGLRVAGSVGGRAPASPLELGRSSLKYFGAAIAEAASNRLDQVVLLPLAGAAQAGLYAVAVTISSVPLAVGHALSGWYFTSIVSAGVGERRDALKAEVVRVSLALGIAVSALLACLTPWLIRWGFGSEFSAAVVPTIVALAGSSAMIASYVAAQALAAEGRGIAMTSCQAGALSVSIGMLFALGPYFGAGGAAVASSAGYLCLLAALLAIGGWSFKRVLPRPRDVLLGMKSLMSPEVR